MAERQVLNFNRLNYKALKNTKSILLGVVFSLMLLALQAQTYVEPFLGYTFHENSAPELTGEVSQIWGDQGFAQRDFTYGLAVSKQLNQQFGIELSGTFLRAILPYFDRGFVGFTGLRIDRYGITILPEYTFNSRLRVGLGASYQLLSNARLGVLRSGLWTEKSGLYDQRQFALLTACSYSFKNIDLSLRYFYSFESESNPRINLLRTQAVELFLGYRFRIGK